MIFHKFHGPDMDQIQHGLFAMSARPWSAIRNIGWDGSKMSSFLGFSNQMSNDPRTFTYFVIISWIILGSADPIIKTIDSIWVHRIRYSSYFVGIFVLILKTGDGIRDKSRELLCEALKSGGPADQNPEGNSPKPASTFRFIFILYKYANR